MGERDVIFLYVSLVGGSSDSKPNRQHRTQPIQPLQRPTSDYVTLTPMTQTSSEWRQS